MNSDQRRVLFASSISYVVVILDTSIVNVALERISVSLGTGVAGLQWIVNAYTLVFATLLLTGGALGDRWGGRRTYFAGLGVFTLASALCGAADTVVILTLARALQGVGAALLVPCSLALLNEACPDPKVKAGALGVWAACGGAALAAGPLIGGFLIAGLGGRSIFLANVPIGILGVWLTSRLKADGPRHAPAPLDLPGQLTAIAALGALIASLIEGRSAGWGSRIILSGFLLFAVATGLFVVLESRSKRPMLPLALFRSGAFSGAAVVAMVTMLVFFGLLFVLSLYFQGTRGYSPLQTGLVFLPMTLIVPCANMVCARWLKAYGPRGPVVGGFFFFTLGFIGLALAPPTATSSRFVITLLLLSIGFGGGLGPPAIAAALMSSVPEERGGIAAGVLNAARQTGECLGVALFGAMIGDHDATAGLRAVSWTAAALCLVTTVIWLVGVRKARRAKP